MFDMLNYDVATYTEHVGISHTPRVCHAYAAMLATLLLPLLLYASCAFYFYATLTRFAYFTPLLMPPVYLRCLPLPPYVIIERYLLLLAFTLTLFTLLLDIVACLLLCHMRC